MSERLPGWLRGALGAQALIMLVFGILLFARPGHAGDVWAWPLTPLAAEAIAAWLLGIGASAAYIALRGDREDMPGPRCPTSSSAPSGSAVRSSPATRSTTRSTACSTCCSPLSVIAVGLAGATLSRREGRYAPAPRD